MKDKVSFEPQISLKGIIMANAIYNFVYNIVLNNMLENAGITDYPRLHSVYELYVWSICDLHAHEITCRIGEWFIISVAIILLAVLIYKITMLVEKNRLEKEMEA